MSPSLKGRRIYFYTKLGSEIVTNSEVTITPVIWTGVLFTLIYYYVKRGSTNL